MFEGKLTFGTEPWSDRVVEVRRALKGSGPVGSMLESQVRDRLRGVFGKVILRCRNADGSDTANVVVDHHETVVTFRTLFADRTEVLDEFGEGLTRAERRGLVQWIEARFDTDDQDNLFVVRHVTVPRSAHTTAFTSWCDAVWAAWEDHVEATEEAEADLHTAWGH